jgi:glycosyltransferase involved in cell wall biosynthesis
MEEAIRSLPSYLERHDMSVQMAKSRLAILCNESSSYADAIRDYSIRLAGAVARETDLQVDLHMRTSAGTWTRVVNKTPSGQSPNRKRLDSGLETYDAVILQYNPFMYGHWGFAPWIAAALWRLRRASPRPKIGLMVHEKYVPMINWRRALMGLWQRLQLLALRASADVVFVSIEAWTEDLARAWPLKPTLHLPVASNLPDMRTFRAEERERLGAREETIVLASFSGNHPTRLTGYLVSAANAVAASGRDVIFLNLGVSPSRLVGLDSRIVLDAPGLVSTRVLGRRLASADIFLAAFGDGVSTRRTTVMAAMQHGVAVVGTDGLWTDSILRQSVGSLHLTPGSDPELFSKAVVSLACDRQQRVALGQAGRSLYVQSFDWPILARRVLNQLDIGQQALGHERNGSIRKRS